MSGKRVGETGALCGALLGSGFRTAVSRIHSNRDKRYRSGCALLHGEGLNRGASNRFVHQVVGSRYQGSCLPGGRR